MSDLYFAEPQWVHLLWAVLAFFVLMVWLERRGGGDLSRFIGEALQAKLITRVSTGRRMARAVLITLACAFMTLALMRPQWGLQFIATPRMGAEIMVCLDVSKSMLAEDVVPNRLGRAKAELADLLSYLDGDQVGLIAFAGRASVLSPLTPDFGFLRLVLDEAGPASVSRGGTRLEEPIRKAIEGFGDTADVSRSILLITDGEDHDSFPLEAAKAAAERGIRILAIGFGDENGSEIMLTDPKTGARKVLRDADGNIARSRLDGDMLREIVLITEGAYIPAGTGVLDLESIYDTHIASLTRGMLDGKGRSVRNDAFQFAVLMALICLIAAVACTAGAIPGNMPRNVQRLNHWLVFLITVSLLSLGSPNQVVAQQASLIDQNAEDANAGTPDSIMSEDVDENSEPAGQDSQPLEQIAPREQYNRALINFDKSTWQEALKDFEQARRNSGADGELRYNSTYNQAWVEIKIADELLETDPDAALKALYRAADWFREAVALREGAEDARFNLEVVLARTLVLADSLENHEPGELIKQVNKAIEEQRQFLADLRQSVDIAESANDPNTVERSRRILRTMASRQLEVLSQSQLLTETVGRQFDTLKAKEESERTPEENMKMTQFEQLLYYLHRSQERMGQARSQMRRLQAERAYRRAANALTHLKRGRDQMLDPVTRMDSLLGDGMELLRLTSAKVATLSSVLGGGVGVSDQRQAPAWLSEKYLIQNQESLEERTRELHEGLSAGLAQSNNQAPDPAASPTDKAKQNQLLLNLAQAEPLLAMSMESFQTAIEQLRDNKLPAAMQSQNEGLVQIASARELFLELRQLIDLLYQDQLRIQQALSANKLSANQLSADKLAADQSNEQGDVRSLVEILEYVPMALELQEKNMQRAPRVGEMISASIIENLDALEQAQAEQQSQQQSQQQPQTQAQPGQPPVDPAQLESERQRLEQADQLQLTVQEDLLRVRDQMRGLLPDNEGLNSSPDITVGSVRNEIELAVASIEELRRLFFSVIDHLKEAARKQVELSDESSDVGALAENASDAETAAKLGPLQNRERSLAATAGSIAEALQEQAKQMGNAPPASGPGGAQQDPQQAAQEKEKMLEAASLVSDGREFMNNAANTMNTIIDGEYLAAADPQAERQAQFESTRGQQTAAVEKLSQAIALLQPPQEQDQQQDQQDQQQDQQEQQAQQGEPQEQQPEQRGDVDQMMQGIRDREAQRREDQSQNQRQGYEPVEKDW